MSLIGQISLSYRTKQIKKKDLSVDQFVTLLTNPHILFDLTVKEHEIINEFLETILKMIAMKNEEEISSIINDEELEQLTIKKLLIAFIQFLC